MDSTELPTSKADLLAQAVIAWASAQTLKRRASWKGLPPDVYLAEKLSERPDCEQELIGLLEHPNQLVVAYSLTALFLLNSSIFSGLPPGLLERKEKITIITGSFSDLLELKAYAKYLRKEWSEKQVEPES